MVSWQLDQGLPLQPRPDFPHQSLIAGTAEEDGLDAPFRMDECRQVPPIVHRPTLGRPAARGSGRSPPLGSHFPFREGLVRPFQVPRSQGNFRLVPVVGDAQRPDQVQVDLGLVLATLFLGTGWVKAHLRRWKA